MTTEDVAPVDSEERLRAAACYLVAATVLRRSPKTIEDARRRVQRMRDRNAPSEAVAWYEDDIARGEADPLGEWYGREGDGEVKPPSGTTAWWPWPERHWRPAGTVEGLLNQAQALLTAERCDLGIGHDDVSDGDHTFRELYDHRWALFSVVCRSHPGLAWRSRLHHDGTMFPGYFIAGMALPFEGIGYQRVSYHVRDDRWDWFAGVQERDRAEEWDGHSPADVIDRLVRWSPR